MHFSGGSDFRGKVSVQYLQVTASGGSDAYISGHPEKLKIHANSGSDIHAYDLVSNFCIVESSGGSDVPVTENKEISGNPIGGSDIYYKGTPSSNASISGGSSIKKNKLKKDKNQ